MTRIKTVPLSEANEDLLHALEAQRSLFPKEYGTPVFRADREMAGIVGSHRLIPDALNHAFSTFGVLMSPDLPLTRRQHEMITTVVSVQTGASTESSRTQSFCVERVSMKSLWQLCDEITGKIA
jgi:hypothetical protein